MKKSTKYSPEVRERAVCMVREHPDEYGFQWAAILYCRQDRLYAENPAPLSWSLRVRRGGTTSMVCCWGVPATVLAVGWGLEFGGKKVVSGAAMPSIALYPCGLWLQ